MKNRFKIFIFLLALVSILSCLALPALAAEDDGECYEWEYDPVSEVLSNSDKQYKRRTLPIGYHVYNRFSEYRFENNHPNSVRSLYSYARDGEILWEKTYTDVAYNAGVSGGILSSPILGKQGTDLEGLIIYSISRTPTDGGGTLVALDTETGEVVWEKALSYYAWSSPVTLYTTEGKSYFILCDSVGKATLFEGATGEALASVSLDSNIEASPAVFENTIVVGTRGQQVFALTVE